MLRRISLLVALGLLLGAPSARAQDLTPATFTAAPEVTAGGDAILAVADFDGSGGRDVVVASRTGDGAAATLTRLPQGETAGARSWAIGPRPVGLTVADVDEDGRADIVTAGQDGLTLLLSRAGYEPADVPVRGGVTAIVAGELTGDAHVDLALVAGATRVLPGRGDGGFGEPLALEGAFHRLHAVVLRRNARTDLVAESSTGLTIFDGGPTGLGPGRHQPLRGRLAFGDFNVDGRTDLAALHSGRVTLHTGNAVGGFYAAGGLEVDERVTSHVVGDVNGDGFDDVTVAIAPGHRLYTLLNRPLGGAVVQAPVELSPRGGLQAQALGDLDADSRPDVVSLAPGAEDSVVQVALNRTPPVHLRSEPGPEPGTLRVRWRLTTFQRPVGRLDLDVGATTFATFASPGIIGYADFRPETEGWFSFRATARDAAGAPLGVTAETPALEVRLRTSAQLSTPAFAPVTVGAAGEPHAVHVLNTGLQALRVRDTLLAAGDFAIVADHCRGATLAPRAECVVQVRFSPVAAGPRAATLRVQANTEAGTEEIELRAEGIVPAVVPAPAPPPAWDVRLAVDTRSGRRTTRFLAFRIENLPRGSSVTVRCPKGCTRRSLTRTYLAGTRLSLRSFAARPLKVGTKLTIRIVTPRLGTLTATLTVRARRAPKLTLR